MAEKTAQQQITDAMTEAAVGAVTVNAAVTALGQAFGKSLDELNERILKSQKQANDLRIGFQQAFGIFEEERGRSLVKNIATVTDSLKAYEISGVNLANNFTKVGQTLDSFVIDKSDKTVMGFAKLVSINEKFKISNDETVKTINYLSTGFGKGTEEVEKFSNKLLQFARVTGQDFNKVFQQFNQNIDNFYTILDPEKAGAQFMSFQQMARGFGTTIDRLMDTAAKFDSIEQGVQFGTQLNNILSYVGGSFDSMLASTMNYDDRIKYIIKSVGDSREAIKSMDEVSQRAFIRQLQQATQLDQRTLQAVLSNEKILDNLENISDFSMKKGEAGFVGELGEGDVKRIITGFTSIEDRAKLFENEYMKIGSIIEKSAVAQSKFLLQLQRQTLGTLADAVFKSDDIKEFKNNLAALGMKALSTIFSPEEVGKFAKEQLDQLRKQIRTETVAFGKSLAIAPGDELGVTPAKKAPTSAIDFAEEIEKGMTAIARAAQTGIVQALGSKPQQEVKITIEATPQIKAMFEILSKATTASAANIVTPVATR